MWYWRDHSKVATVDMPLILKGNIEPFTVSALLLKMRSGFSISLQVNLQGVFWIQNATWFYYRLLQIINPLKSCLKDPFLPPEHTLAFSISSQRTVGTPFASHSFIFNFGKDRNMSSVLNNSANCKPWKRSVERSRQRQTFLLTGKLIATYR